MLSWSLPDLGLEREGNIIAPTFNRWDARTLGVPKNRPVPQVSYTTLLLVPVAGKYRFWLDSAGRSTLWVNGAWLSTGATGGPAPLDITLPAGPCPIRIDYASPGAADFITL